MRSSYNLRSNSQNTSVPQQTSRRNSQKSGTQGNVNQITTEAIIESIPDDSDKEKNE